MAILLGAARQRAAGRRARQRKLFGLRTGRTGAGGGWSFFYLVIFAAATNGAAAFLVNKVVEQGQRIAQERAGHVVVSDSFVRYANTKMTAARKAGRSNDDALRDQDWVILRQASRTADRDDTEVGLERRRIETVLRNGNLANFVSEDDVAKGVAGLGWSGLPAMLGSLVLMLWSAMVVFGGEGLELDVQRSRHPMWEWLFSHPAPPGAVFLAEMLAPIAANPTYWFVPIVPGVLYGMAYDTAAGVSAAVLVGIPMLLAAACLGKALEILVLLRTAPRSRGALVGTMGWLGYISAAAMFVGFLPVGGLIRAIAPALAVPAEVPWPWLGLMLGARPAGGFSFVQGVATCALLSGATIAGSVALSLVATRQGLSGRVGRGDTRPSRQAGFGRYAAYTKELIWFRRDRSALVQAVLVPLSMAAFQLINLRGFLSRTQSRWSLICGCAVLLGTYFLTVLGPRSLASEGATLWFALTWPLGLEKLLRAKARLWAALSSIIVALALGYAVFAFPQAWWKIAIVGLGWGLFSLAMAEKSVTLAQVTSDSGEVQGPRRRGREWAVQLGTLSFTIGVLTENVPVAITGIVYSSLTAAAMWQNFRARLPYLLDPWSERLPEPPTLMHAMIGIAALVDGGAVLIGLATAVAGADGAAAALTIAYGISAVIVSLVTARFLASRHVPPAAVWFWPRPDRMLPTGFTGRAATVLAGIGLGLGLGILALGYEEAVRHIPGLSDLFANSDKAFRTVPHLEVAYAVAAVAIAPIAEEYLFRGLLYRTLDREWQDGRAVAASAIFFASYHPVLAWLPVGALGALNAALFKRTGWLVPSIALHMTYNAVVVGWMVVRTG